MELMFWIYAALSVSVSALLYLILWSTLYVLITLAQTSPLL
jgi:hypothetical protein